MGMLTMMLTMATWGCATWRAGSACYAYACYGHASYGYACYVYACYGYACYGYACYGYASYIQVGLRYMAGGLAALKMSPPQLSASASMLQKVT